MAIKRIKVYQREVRACIDCPDWEMCSISEDEEIPEGCPLADA